MNLMDHKHLLFEGINFENKLVRNVSEYNILPDIPEKYKGENYILTQEIDNDRLIEAITFGLYETTSYWDILMSLNGITNHNQLPVNYDIVLARTRTSLAKWLEVAVYMSPNNLVEQFNEIITDLDAGRAITLSFGILRENEFVKQKYIDLLDEEVEKNEKFRNFKYLSLSDMGELEAVFSELKQMPKIAIDLIINKDEIQPIEQLAF